MLAVGVLLLAVACGRPVLAVPDSSACPTIEVMPPMRGAIVVVAKGGSAGETFKGKFALEGVDGIGLESAPVSLTLPPAGRVEMRFAITRKPKASFLLGCRLINDRGEDVPRIPRKRYAIVDTFTNGEPGKPVTGCLCELDGDENVNAKAALEYAPCPDGRSGDICAKLDYEFDPGLRFVRICPRPFVKIPGKPLAAKLWVKACGVDGLARLRIVDSAGQTFQADYGRTGFTGWQCMTARMTPDGMTHWGGKNDGIIRYPISWDALFLVDSGNGEKKKGTLYLGGMMLVYD